MKCLCGYEYEDNGYMAWHKKYKVLKGDKAFIIAKNDILVDTELDGLIEHHIYICPKCGTVKVEL